MCQRYHRTLGVSNTSIAYEAISWVDIRAARAVVCGMVAPTPQPTNDDILSLREVSTILRVHPMTTYKLVRCGVLPMRKIGAQWRIRRRVLLDWVDQGGMRSSSLRHESTTVLAR